MNINMILACLCKRRENEFFQIIAYEKLNNKILKRLEAATLFLAFLVFYSKGVILVAKIHLKANQNQNPLCIYRTKLIQH